jgi:hypothetical protein
VGPVGAEVLVQQQVGREALGAVPVVDDERQGVALDLALVVATERVAVEDAGGGRGLHERAQVAARSAAPPRGPGGRRRPRRRL